MIDQYRALIQYSIPKDLPGVKDTKFQTDWYCAKVSANVTSLRPKNI